MDVFIKQFDELSLIEFHDIVALRISVFVVEQNCPYQELDGKDKMSFHLFVKEGDSIVGTARILPPGLSYPEIAIGRVVSSIDKRDCGLGHLIMEESLKFISNHWKDPQNVKLSAQSHLKKYYEKHGFTSTGKEYLEDGIPHTEMILVKNVNK